MQSGQELQGAEETAEASGSRGRAVRAQTGASRVKTTIWESRFTINVYYGNIAWCSLFECVWDKNTGIYTGAMPHHRYFPAATRIQAFQA